MKRWLVYFKDFKANLNTQKYNYAIYKHLYLFENANIKLEFTEDLIQHFLKLGEMRNLFTIYFGLNKKDQKSLLIYMLNYIQEEDLDYTIFANNFYDNILTTLTKNELKKYLNTIWNNIGKHCSAKLIIKIFKILNQDEVLNTLIEDIKNPLLIEKLLKYLPNPQKFLTNPYINLREAASKIILKDKSVKKLNYTKLLRNYFVNLFKEIFPGNISRSCSEYFIYSNEKFQLEFKWMNGYFSPSEDPKLVSSYKRDHNFLYFLLNLKENNIRKRTINNNLEDSLINICYEDNYIFDSLKIPKNQVLNFINSLEEKEKLIKCIKEKFRI